MTVQDSSTRETLPFLLLGVGAGLAVIAVRAVGWRGEGATVLALFLGAGLTLVTTVLLPRKLQDWYEGLSERALQWLGAMLMIAFLVLLGMVGTRY